jgi:hypothetical protein
MGMYTSVLMRKLVAGAAVAMAMAGATGTALADNFDDHGIDMTGSRLDVVVFGRVRSNCEIQGGGTIDFGELTGGEEATGQLALNCNLPFELTLASRNGGLSHETRPMGEGPYAGNLDYDVRLELPLLSPEPGLMTAQLHSRDGSVTLSSGDAIASGIGRIKFSTRNIPNQGLLAGHYFETLTISVTPRV